MNSNSSLPTLRAATQKKRGRKLTQDQAAYLPLWIDEVIGGLGWQGDGWLFVSPQKGKGFCCCSIEAKTTAVGASLGNVPNKSQVRKAVTADACLKGILCSAIFDRPLEAAYFWALHLFFAQISREKRESRRRLCQQRWKRKWSTGCELMMSNRTIKCW